MTDPKRARPNAGRRTKYTPEVVARVLEGVAAGMKHYHVAQYAGIDQSLLYRWQRKYPEFKRQFEEAEMRLVARNLALIQKAALEGTWQAAAWMLERRHPEHYGRQVTHRGSDEQPVRVEVVWRDEDDSR